MTTCMGLQQSGDAAAAWFLDNLQIPFTLVVVYLLALYFGTRYMKDKPAYDLKKCVAGHVWRCTASVAVCLTWCWNARTSRWF